MKVPYRVLERNEPEQVVFGTDDLVRGPRAFLQPPPEIGRARRPSDTGRPGVGGGFAEHDQCAAAIQEIDQRPSVPPEQIGMQPVGHDQQTDICEIAGRQLGSINRAVEQAAVAITVDCLVVIECFAAEYGQRHDCISFRKSQSSNCGTILPVVSVAPAYCQRSLPP